MLAPIILQPRSTTLYVGKIAPSVSNELIKQLLEACGTVKEWKRMEDPETKALKPFGFCEYEEAEGVIRALNLLNNLAVGGKVVQSPRPSAQQPASSLQLVDVKAIDKLLSAGAVTEVQYADSKIY